MSDAPPQTLSETIAGAKIVICVGSGGVGKTTTSAVVALHGALAGSADVALIPEIPYHVDRIVDVIKARARRGRTYTLIVVAEGARRAGGEQVVQDSGLRSHGQGWYPPHPWPFAQIWVSTPAKFEVSSGVCNPSGTSGS